VYFGTPEAGHAAGDLMLSTSTGEMWVALNVENTWQKIYEPCFSSVVVSGQNTIAANLPTSALTVAAGTGITLTTNATTDTLTITNSGSVSDGDKGDITVSGSGATWTIDNDSVTYAKLQNVTDDRLLGRSAGSDGNCQEITVGTGLDLSGGSLTNSGVTSVSGAGLATGTVTTTGSITVTAASAADMETGTSTTVAVTPAVAHRHASAMKVWGANNWSSGTPNILASYNVSSVSDTGVGIVQYNFTTSFSTGNYAQHAAATGTSLFTAVAANGGTGSIEVYIRDSGGTLTDSSSAHLVCAGDL
jgi:hypothetical protein